MKYMHKVQPNADIRAMMDGKQKVRDMWELADNQVRRYINAWGLLSRELQEKVILMLNEELKARRSGIPQNTASN